MIFTLAVLAQFFTLSTHAADGTQSIECKFTNQDSKDRVLLTLDNPQSGTFLYVDGSDDKENVQNTGKITLKRVEDSKDITKKDYAQFQAKWSTGQNDGWLMIEFDFSMPKNLILKNAAAFKAELSTNITDQKPSILNGNDALDCISKFDSKSKI